MPNQAHIDWSEGSAFIQQGTIYASPNSKRVVLIPPPNQDFNYKEIFAHKSTSTDGSLHDLELEGFKQPVRWHDSYGWMAFFPLLPSFVSLPFEFLCWSPKLFCHRDGQMNTRVPKQPPTWAMDTLEQRKWHDCEVNLILVAEKVRLWCRIPGTPPPVPQSFGYMLKHRTEEAAYRSINASRKAFILWMGYLSYLCAQSRREVYSKHIKHDPRSPVPAWHHRLRSEHSEITEAWLDGFYNSNVYSYNAKTPRAGIVYDWTSTHPTQPPIDWFLEHSIPVYYPWRIQEEEFIVTHLNVNPHLQPPHDLLAQLLTELFESMDVSLAAAFARKFFSHVHPTEGLTMDVLRDKYSRTLVYSILSNNFAHNTEALDRYMSRPYKELEATLQKKDEEQRQLAIDSANLPTLYMIELPHENLKLLSSVHDDWMHTGLRGSRSGTKFWPQRLKKRG